MEVDEIDAGPAAEVLYVNEHMKLYCDASERGVNYIVA
jgi:hypothetical protein